MCDILTEILCVILCNILCDILSNFSNKRTLQIIENLLAEYTKGVRTNIVGVKQTNRNTNKVLTKLENYQLF